MTGLELVSASMRVIGVLAANETATATEAQNALTSLNNLIDSWSTEGLLINEIVREVFAITAGQQTYTMGTSGTFNTTRPQLIENAGIQVPGTSPIVELPMKIINKDQYAGIIVKSITSSVPLYLYEDGNYPLDNVNLWPVPSVNTNIVLYSWKPLANVPLLTTTLSFPPGYARALTFNLGQELAPEYGRQVPETVQMIAMESKANIKRMNIKPHYMTVDKALVPKPAVWNWMTGEPS